LRIILYREERGFWVQSSHFESKDVALLSIPEVSFVNSKEMDVAFLLNSLSPKSLIHRFAQNIPKALEELDLEYERLAEKHGLFSPREGLPKFHFLCTSLIEERGSVFPDVDEKYRNSLRPFQALIEKAKADCSVTRRIEELGDYVGLWEKRSSLLEKAQEIARTKFRLSDYTVFFLMSLSSRFGMPCMVHDKYVFVNAQKQQEDFVVDAMFHELLHQLLLGHRYSREGKFFVGHFLWQPRRAMMEEIILPCLQMELSEDSEKRKMERQRVLHLEERLTFLEPFKPLFSKVLYDWEEEYMLSQNVKLQEFIDMCTRKYLKPLDFMSAMRKMSARSTNPTLPSSSSP
jgi:hypothetical protein